MVARELERLASSRGRARAAARARAPGTGTRSRSSSSLSDITRWPPSSSPANSPSTSRTAGAGAGSTAGRPSTRPSVRAYSAFVTGCGAVTFTGPDRRSFRQRELDRPDHVVDRDPAHVLAPAADTARRDPSRNSGSCARSAPPAALCTIPKRGFTTRMPASRAGSAAASQSRTTPARKPSPDRASLRHRLVAAIAVVADRGRAHEHARPRVAARRPPRARSRVPSTRLSRIRRFFASVHRPATVSPARCTTASTPSSAAGSISPAVGIPAKLARAGAARSGSGAPPRGRLPRGARRAPSRSARLLL